MCRHNIDSINNDTHIGTRYVILAKHWMWLPDDGSMRIETCCRHNTENISIGTLVPDM